MTNPVYDLKTGYPDINLVPRQRISEITAEVLGSGRGWQYGGDLQGTLATREQIARSSATPAASRSRPTKS